MENNNTNEQVAPTPVTTEEGALTSTNQSPSQKQPASTQHSETDHDNKAVIPEDGEGVAVELRGITVLSMRKIREKITSKTDSNLQWIKMVDRMWEAGGANAVEAAIHGFHLNISHPMIAEVVRKKEEAQAHIQALDLTKVANAKQKFMLSPKATRILTDCQRRLEQETGGSWEFRDVIALAWLSYGVVYYQTLINSMSSQSEPITNKS